MRPASRQARARASLRGAARSTAATLNGRRTEAGGCGRTTLSLRITDTKLVPTTTSRPEISIVRTRSGDRSSRGSSCAAAYGCSSAGRASPLGHRKVVGCNRCRATANKASCRPRATRGHGQASGALSHGNAVRARGALRRAAAAAGAPAAHLELCAEAAGRARRREQLGQRRKQRLCGRQSAADCAHRQQHPRRVLHCLRAGGRTC